MMSHFIFYFLLIPFVGTSSERKEAEQDTLVLLFGNVTSESLEMEVSLHRNGDENPDLIVKWNINNGDITAKWRMNDYKKIFMDGNKNIWIANIDTSYGGKYYIQSFHKREVEIVISGSSNNPTITVLVIIAVVLLSLFAMTLAFICYKYGKCHCKKKDKDEGQNIPLIETSPPPIKGLGAEAARIIERDDHEMRPDTMNNTRHGRIPKDVYRFLYDDIPFDPNCLE